MPLTPQDFVTKWRRSQVNERAGYQQHFLDLCQLAGHPTPAELDPKGQFFRFEANASKADGGEGFADVWYRGHFALEYKGKHANLDRAYQQLLQYREALENPPLLIVCDLETIVIHPNFLNTVNRPITLTYDDLLTPDGLTTLRAIFHNPAALKPTQTTDAVTQKAAAQFARLADQLRQAGHPPHEAAHFLIQLLFCLFAEDVELIPNHLFTRMVQSHRNRPQSFHASLGQLFAAMATGGVFGLDEIPWFDGQLFDNARPLPLDADGLDILLDTSSLDWSSIEPSIFGTLFERSLDPSKRAQLGAHYTSREDILLIIEPVLMAPLRRRWAEVQTQAQALAAEGQDAPAPRRKRLTEQLQNLLRGFADEIAAVRVLDPACGSGNFLYLALHRLLDLQKEVIQLAVELGGMGFFPTVTPGQLHGIEVNEYAHQLAQATIQIGYIQWQRNNGYGYSFSPILQPLEQIRRMDAILAYDDQGRPTEPAWPPADVIIGNPPFLGGKKMRAELGDEYMAALFGVYHGRVPREADLVCYWFEKARAMIEEESVNRAGLLATQGIRGGANRKVLERILETGNIFWAYSDRNWILDGATVHVSMVGFDNNADNNLLLDDHNVTRINPDLTSASNLTTATQLPENFGISFMGDTKVGPFDISPDLAHTMLAAVGNPNGRPNSDVIRLWVNGKDVTSRSRGMWIIDFGVEMSEEDAAKYEQPFAYVLENIKKQRDAANKSWYHAEWWLHYATRPAMRKAIEVLPRYIATPTVAKHRLFVWLTNPTLPDHQLIVFARSDDYFFGVLHSRLHELWARRTGTQLREAESGARYTPTTTFETYPFPWPPGQEPPDDPRVQAIAAAAQELNQLRENWLNPPGASAAELKKRTLTNLYNQRPTWLQHAHRKLDTAVFAAYSWPPDLTDEDILARLLALNLERAA
ncbi:MAG TPA: hypothetical protein PLA25_01390 [Anaerolineaceae bacterium]|nr:hypothetical protein [Anaerolineaceae bacterium]